MKLSDTQLRWVGRLSWWPPVYMVLFMGFMICWALGIFGVAGAGAVVGQIDPDLGGMVAGGIMLLMMAAFGLVFILHLLTMIWILAQLVFYVVHVVDNPGLEDNDRLLWGVVVVFAGFVGQLIYFYKVVLPALDELPAGRPTDSAQA